MSGFPWIALVCFLSVIAAEVVTVSASPSFSALEEGGWRGQSNVCKVLQAHGLPTGLLPEGIIDFSIDEGSGRFEAYLERPCTARFEDEVHYDCKITGKISYGQIGAISGILAQDLFLWFPVKGIRVDIPSTGLIYFDVGVIYKQFPLSLFETPPKCRDSTAAATLGNPQTSLLPVDSTSVSECGSGETVAKLCEEGWLL